MKKKMIALMTIVLFMVISIGNQNANANGIGRTISGKIFLPNGEVAPKGGITIIVYGKYVNHTTQTRGAWQSDFFTIKEGENSTNYDVYVEVDNDNQGKFAIEYGFDHQGSASYKPHGYYIKNINHSIPDYAQAEWIDLNQESAKNIDIELVKGIRISGKIKLQNGLPRYGEKQISIHAVDDNKTPDYYADDLYGSAFVLIENSSEIEYSLIVPPAFLKHYRINYSIINNTSKQYVGVGYFCKDAAQNTTVDKSKATPVEVTIEDIVNIDMAPIVIPDQSKPINSTVTKQNDTKVVKDILVKGTVSLPKGMKAKTDYNIVVQASIVIESSKGKGYRLTAIAKGKIAKNRNDVSYVLKIPENLKGKYVISYNIDNNQNDYQKQGFYSTKGTVKNIKAATIIDISKGNKVGVNIQVLPK